MNVENMIKVQNLIARLTSVSAVSLMRGVQKDFKDSIILNRAIAAGEIESELYVETSIFTTSENKVKRAAIFENGQFKLVSIDALNGAANTVYQIVVTGFSRPTIGLAFGEVKATRSKVARWRETIVVAFDTAKNEVVLGQYKTRKGISEFVTYEGIADARDAAEEIAPVAIPSALIRLNENKAPLAHMNYKDVMIDGRDGEQIRVDTLAYLFKKQTELENAERKARKNAETQPA